VGGGTPILKSSIIKKKEKKKKKKGSTKNKPKTTIMERRIYLGQTIRPKERGKKKKIKGERGDRRRKKVAIGAGKT